MPSNNDTKDQNNSGWEGLEILQNEIQAWQVTNFPECKEWELALGVCEEAGELAQCVLKLHRGMRADEFDEERLKDAVGDIIVYLLGICYTRDWRMSDVLRSTSEKVLKRKWQ